jgi:peptidoglycan biosynthesis protein MviN/MurJ (putative lipid II flippase)
VDCGAAWRGAVLGNILRGAAGGEFLSPLAVGSRPQQLLRADLAQVAPWQARDRNADRFTRRCLLAMLSVAGVIALLAIFFGKYIIAIIAPGFDEWRQLFAAFLLLMVAPYIVLVGLVVVIAAALNAEGRVVAVVISTIAFNVVIVSALVVMPNGEIDQAHTTFWLAFAVTAAGLIQLAVTAVTWLATGRRWQRTRVQAPDQTHAFFARVLPGLIATGSHNSS